MKAVLKSFFLADEQVMKYGMARQAIMNGNFDVWQRGTSISLTDASTLFQADKWYDQLDKNGGTLPTLTRSKQVLTFGDIVNSFYFTRLSTNGAGTSLGVSSYHGLRQRIEFGTRMLCGLNRKVTVSFWARSSIANKRICPTLSQGYGTGGSPSAEEQILGTPITLTSSWTKYTATFTTNTIIGKSFGSNDNDYLSVNFWHEWGTTFGNTYVQTGVTAETYVGSGNIDIAQVQLCAGDVALPFQPKSYEEELRACMRYFERFDFTSMVVGNGFYQSTTQFYCVLHYSKKRSVPTITSPAAANQYRVLIPGGATAVTGLDFSNDKNLERAIILATTSAQTLGISGILQRADGQSPIIEVSSEL